LSALETADRQEGEVAEAKSARLKDKIATLREQMRRHKTLEAAVHAAPDKQISLTDPDARSMATSDKDTGMVGYNVQALVDAHAAHEVTNIGNDRSQPGRGKRRRACANRRRSPIASSHVVTLWCTSISLEHHRAGPVAGPAF
jgi:hypothetical protein